jgi:hypothetical protein
MQAGADDWYLRKIEKQPNEVRQYEKKRNDQGRIPFSADRCEDQGTGRLEGQDAHSRRCRPEQVIGSRVESGAFLHVP